MIDGHRSNFPTSLDEFKEMSEISPALQKSIFRYRELKAKGNNRTTKEETEYQELSTSLSSYICSAEDWNKLCDSMYNLEKHYLDKNFDQFVEDAKTDIVQTAEDAVDTAVNTAIQTTIKEYVEGKVPFNVIISETEPSYIPGALWIKPKLS